MPAPRSAMTPPVRSSPASPRRTTGGVRRPLRVGHLAGGGAAVAGVVLTVRAVLGEHALLGFPRLAWPAVLTLLIGAVVAVASVRPWRRRFPRGFITIGLWLVTAASLAGSCFILLNLIELVVTGSVTDRDGNSDWSTFIERLVAAGLAVLFVAAAISWRGRISGRCARCGAPHPTGAVELVHPAPHAAPRGVRWAAYAGCLTFAPYLTMHGVGMIGIIPGAEQHYDFDVPLPLAFVTFALGLVGPAVFLLLGLVRPWGMRFPRWTLWLAGRRVPRFLPLSPVFLVAPTLALYGVGSVPYAVASGQADQLWGIGGAASLAFGGYGCALLVAAVSYRRRTRPRCVSATGRPEKAQVPVASGPLG